MAFSLSTSSFTTTHASWGNFHFNNKKKKKACNQISMPPSEIHINFDVEKNY